MCLPTECSNRALLTICDSIALNILDNDAILRGVGNELHLHGAKESTRVHDHNLNCLIRLKGKIHGIEKGAGLNAGKLIVFGEKEFILLEYDEHHFYERYRANLTDWIKAATFLEDETGFVLLTAHSVLLRFSYAFEDDVKEKCMIVERISCVDKSTLYCAHLHGTSMKDLIVFGGNAFGELLIWQPADYSIENDKKITPLLQRRYAHNGVIFSIDYDLIEDLLVTTSDDRSITFWRVGIKNGWTHAEIKSIAIGFGHQSRVFQGRIIRHDNTTYAITVGEDSHFCLWDCNGELVNKKRIQFGAVIWNFAYAKSTNTLYTVGSTGNMIPYNLTAALEEKQHNIPKKLTAPNTLDETEYIAKVKFLTKCLVIGRTNRNRLVTNDLNRNIWLEVDVFAGSKCTVLEVHKNLVALCGYKRFTLLEYENETLREVYDGTVLNGVIRSFHFLSETHYLLSDEVGNCILLERKRLNEPHHIELPKCKERWLTAALLINEKLLLVSNRLGNIMLYQYSTESNIYELQHILKHPHGHLGATVLKLRELNECFAYVQSAGHDGTLKTLRIDCKRPSVFIEIHQIVPVAWIEAAVPVDTTEVFLGFNDNHFIVWNAEHDTTVQVPCGGGHRSWHFYIYKDESKGHRIKLMFIKNKTVLLYELPLFNELHGGINIPQRNRWHTKSCNLLALVEQRMGKDLVTISAGDDNLIKVATLEYNKSQATLHQKAEIHTHISNVRALKILQTSPNDCIIFSGGGRAQLCATKINLNNFKIVQLFNYTLKATSDDDTQCTETYSFDPETRIMSMEVLPQENSIYSIYLACSDGYLRKFSIGNNFDVSLDEEIYYGRCLLEVRLVGDIFLISTATDGVLSLFNIEMTTVYMKLSLHASGINALDIHYKPEEQKLHVLTGGDDQAVTYTQISLRNLYRPAVVEELHLPQLHTAQVTAARFSNCGRYLLTSGVDQNLVEYDLEQRKVVRVTHSSVADIKGLALNNENNLCFLYGSGLQIFELSR